MNVNAVLESVVSSAQRLGYTENRVHVLQRSYDLENNLERNALFSSRGPFCEELYRQMMGEAVDSPSVLACDYLFTKRSSGKHWVQKGWRRIS